MNYAYKNYLYIYNIKLMEENTLLIKKITFKHAFFCFCFRNNFRKQPNKGQTLVSTWVGRGCRKSSLEPLVPLPPISHLRNPPEGNRNLDSRSPNW